MVRITQLADRTGVSPRRLRHYETHNLLQPGRDARGWRTYAEHDVERVEAIDRLVSSGIPVELAVRILGAGSGASGQDDVGADVLDDIAVYYRQLDARARCLQRNRDALAAWLTARGMTVTDTTAPEKQR